MTPRVAREHLDFARRLRRDMTGAETIVWGVLRNRGVPAKFRRQVPIGPYVADFACPSARLVVELDGRAHQTFEQKAHDHVRDNWLAQQGWTVLRISNDLVLGGGDFLSDIQSALESRPSPSFDG